MVWYSGHMSWDAFWHNLDRLWHSDWKLVGYALIAVIWYNLGQIWTQSWTRWVSMGMTILFTLYLVWHWHINRHELGLERRSVVRGLLWGGAAVLAIGLVLGLAFLFRPAAFIDNRYHVGWGEAWSTMLVSIPLRTVLFEEFLFRGVLLGSLQRLVRIRWAVIISSITFGLWHIQPSLYLSTSSEALHKAGATTGNPALAAVLVSVVATTVAGGAFAWLKLRSTSLIAPILAHWAINALSVGLVVAAYARVH